MSNCVLIHGRDEHGQPIHREAVVGFLCHAHRRRMDDTVHEIGELWTDLDLILEANSAPKDETPKTRHLKAAEAPAPANLEALALRDHRSSSTVIPPNPKIPKHEGDPSTPIPPARFIVGSWLSVVAEERPLSSTLPRSILAQLAILARHGDWIAAQPWVDDYLGELIDVRKALKAAVRDQVYRRVGQCPLFPEGQDQPCGGALLEENGSGVVKCADCRASWVTPQEQARLAITLGETA